MFSQLSGPLGQQLTWVLLHFLWQGTLVAALLAAALSVARTSQRRYLLSVLALAVMAAMPSGTFCVLDPHGGPNENQTVVLLTHSATPSGTGVPDSRIKSGSDPGAALTTGEVRSPSRLTIWAIRLQPYLLAGWLAGVLVLNARLLSAWMGTLWLRGGRVPLKGDLLPRIDALRRRIGLAGRCCVCGSARAGEAMVVGLWRPIVLVPLAWLSDLPPEVLEAVVAHELAHIRRHDLWVTWLQRVLESVLFFHPAMWWISRRIALEREACCDELAVQATGGRTAYARALETVGRRFAADQALLLATSFHGESEMQLLARVRRVLGHKPHPETGSAWLAGFVLLAVALGAGLMVASSGRASQADEEPNRETPAAESGHERSPEAEAGRRRSPEAEAGTRRSAEAEAGTRRSAEAEAGTRRSPEAERKERRSAETEEGERRERPERDAPDGRERRKEGEPAERKEGGERKGLNALRDFEPQNDREKALMGVINDLQEQLNDLRREVRQLRVKERPRDGEGSRKSGPRDGEGPRKPGIRDGEGPRKPGPRDGEGPRKPGPRDGERPRKPGPRDGEGPPKPGPRDGERPDKPDLRTRDAG